MSDLPERIWACMGGPMVGLFVSGGNNGGWPEYVSADIVQALTAERDRLRAASDDVIRETFASYRQAEEAYAAHLRAEAENAQMRKALNQSRLAFAGYVSVQSAIDLIDRATLDPDRLREDRDARSEIDRENGHE